MRQPCASNSLTICARIYSEPWHDISQESSPVYECGERNKLMRTSSMSSSVSGFIIFPNVIVPPCLWSRGMLPLGLNISEVADMA